MLSVTIFAQFIKIWDRNINYISKIYNIFDEKI